MGDSIAAANSSGGYRGADPENPYGYQGANGGITNWRNNVVADASSSSAGPKQELTDADLSWIRAENGWADPDQRYAGVQLAAAGGVKFMNTPQPAVDSFDVAESKRLATGTRTRLEEKLSASYREGAEIWAKGDALNEQPFDFDNRAEAAERIAGIKDVSRQEKAWNSRQITTLEELKQAGGLSADQEYERSLRVSIGGMAMALGAVGAAPLGGMTASRPRVQERLPSEVVRGLTAEAPAREALPDRMLADADFANRAVTGVAADLGPRFVGGSTYAERLAQTPISNGSWSGARGESVFTSTDPAVVGILGTNGIPYKDTRVNFSSVAIGQVEISNMTTNITSNFRQADVMFAEQMGVSSKEVRRFREENGYTWHEVEDLKTMQLVPGVVNNKFGHIGGRGEINAGRRQSN